MRMLDASLYRARASAASTRPSGSEEINTIGEAMDGWWRSQPSTHPGDW
ncbi:hypothetical protein AB0952_09370 [Streptomyces caniferus]